MPEERDANEMLEATGEQLSLLRDLGVAEKELMGMTSQDAEELIAELRAIREDAGRLGCS
jgi:hypothetical protein